MVHSSILLILNFEGRKHNCLYEEASGIFSQRMEESRITLPFSAKLMKTPFHSLSKIYYVKLLLAISSALPYDSSHELFKAHSLVPTETFLSLGSILFNHEYLNADY